ncbi:hypothetical protein K6U06_14690 [Acidiferrimicrobium sp. IK]|uniref:DUF6036 family nucleotidyltransferase n=1 Tax=Acidiferrimicrobium sp. IK TaxID=2871700 RepID=UPI0021CB7F54|nr:DUF6036 family nucleotidyltransferase [Acidiferrimicrobium sp. IK]MCU4185613.1 hypothetical protein [Acidiferrimicrobium sp. IK]
MLFEADIRRLLTALATELSARKVKARIFVVGGAAMALAYYDRPATRDVDAIFAPADLVLEAAAVVGRREGAPASWLNDAAKLFVPEHVGLDSGPTVVAVEGITVSVAPADLLLAMKLRASRGRRDVEDMAVLLDRLDISTEGQALDIYERFFPEDPLPDRAGPALAHALRVTHRP